jgi:hypothetical protein
MSSRDYVIVVRLKSDPFVRATRFGNNVNQRIKHIKQSILGNTTDTELQQQFGAHHQSDIEFVVCPVSRVLPF